MRIAMLYTANHLFAKSSQNVLCVIKQSISIFNLSIKHGIHRYIINHIVSWCYRDDFCREVQHFPYENDKQYMGERKHLVKVIRLIQRWYIIRRFIWVVVVTNIFLI